MQINITTKPFFLETSANDTFESVVTFNNEKFGAEKPSGIWVVGVLAILSKLVQIKIIFNSKIMIKYPSYIKLFLLSNQKIRQFFLLGRHIDSQRNFDYHHSKEDHTIDEYTIDLELGNSAITSKVYLLVKYILPFSESINK